VTALGWGAVADGAAWLYARFADESAETIRVDLATGAVEPLAVPPDGGASHVRAGGDRIAAAWGTGLDAWSLALLDLADGSWTVADWPAGLLPILAAPLPDGRVVARWGAADADGRPVGGFASYDPADGTWTVDAEVCGANRTGSSGDLVVVDGEPLWFEWPRASDPAGNPTFGLGTITLP
jgi:hypothetical protein